VDYAATTGTPIRATADGTVHYQGKKGAYGRAVILGHGGQRSTLYAHLSRFNAQVRKGTRVRQGQIIGYVGSSGLVTGPHLHYEFRVGGIHKDPLNVELPQGKPVPVALHEDFVRHTSALARRLEATATLTLAAR
jgi:murein DD-endopeptidase MepM/ murein hydrolase activator NlpD